MKYRVQGVGGCRVYGGAGGRDGDLWSGQGRITGGSGRGVKRMRERIAVQVMPRYTAVCADGVMTIGNTM